jgi:hypothetical protein
MRASISSVAFASELLLFDSKMLLTGPPGDPDRMRPGNHEFFIYSKALRAILTVT